MSLPLLHRSNQWSNRATNRKAPMTLIDTNWLGYLAACLTTGSFVPQAWQTFRSDNLAGISVSMYSAFTAGVALWLLYGVALGEWPIIIANLVTLALASVILVRTVRARRARRARPVA